MQARRGVGEPPPSAGPVGDPCRGTSLPSPGPVDPALRRSLLRRRRQHRVLTHLPEPAVVPVRGRYLRCSLNPALPSWLSGPSCEARRTRSSLRLSPTGLGSTPTASNKTSTRRVSTPYRGRGQGARPRARCNGRNRTGLRVSARAPRSVLPAGAKVGPGSLAFARMAISLRGRPGCAREGPPLPSRERSRAALESSARASTRPRGRSELRPVVPTASPARTTRNSLHRETHSRRSAGGGR